MNQPASRMPKYLPSKNCRLVTGLLMSVTAVRPSISSLTDMLASRTQNSIVDNMIMSKPTASSSCNRRQT